MIKGSKQQKNTTYNNIYTPNKGAPEYVKQNINRYKERHKNTITVLFTPIDHPYRKSIGKYYEQADSLLSEPPGKPYKQLPDAI